ncbi:hypothetical protein F2P56_008650 [Juglans regia]|uniref:Transcription factor MYB27-like n=2 Tax=Juglans regia TaxID=51240 RepID=A0A2I4E5X3_JUGRE|nr:transcription factor MYB27-like [Juglans regia]XP_018814801.2 transcription factor MYB27-like [Juglans regia]XP_018814803.2 transcription factor MYB27-like [Juglans regia]XP_018814806.2 transcription factor MYB27-like [Juglans regia]XP_035545221.1 transcription factor MYB27-like [Juglans regia]XP_035545222.1 transcription factor MYB27-like [Juglans regia]XP_035545223.1 transcription factor MYB27-like [Juglans regia]XP_035545224.1 transcription factor MYB27-like [Juglans regia]XP_03554522
MLQTTMAYQVAMQGGRLRKGPWVEEEDERLTTFVSLMGERRWDSIARASGLQRSGKSCRLRWMNYLRPDLKHGQLSIDEERIILQLHELWGNKWSKIARRLPGRTDNEIKNYWRTHLRKRTQLAQEERNFHSKINNAEQDFFFHEQGGMTTVRYQCGNKGSVDKDSWGTMNDISSDALGFSDLQFTCSPYETRLSDWMSGLSDDQSKIKHQEDCNTIESCCCYLAWISDNSNTWDYSGSLWDMD